MIEADKPHDYVCWVIPLNPNGDYREMAHFERAFTAADALTQIQLKLSHGSRRTQISRIEPFEEEKHQSLPEVGRYVRLTKAEGRSGWDPT